jgi:carbamoyltransferase
MHEEPIVCTPDDAIRSFRAGHLDYLAIGDFIVPSPEPVRRSLRPVHAVALSR